MNTHRLLFAVSGASGMPLAHALLTFFRAVPALELHLIVSQHAREVMNYETPLSEKAPRPAIDELADSVYDPNDFSAPPASGSWPCHGMLICPCSMATLAAIATGNGHTLIHRAADVTLKEGRKLILVPRESPLNRIHLSNLLAAFDAGATIMPFMPAYYLDSPTERAQMQHFAGRVLDQLKIAQSLSTRWKE